MEYNTDSIQDLSLPDVLRMRPQLYLSTCFSEGSLDSLPIEIACHAIDEYFDKRCTALKIEIGVDCFLIEYDAGIPLTILHDDITKAEAIMTLLFACKNHKKHISVGEEFCKLGMAMVNAASERCELFTISDGSEGIFFFETGKITSKKIIPSNSKTEVTRIFVQPDKSIFQDLQLTLDGTKNKADKLKNKLPGFNITVSQNKLLKGIF